MVGLGLIGVLIQALSVSLLVMAFLFVFGLLSVPADVQARWIGEPPHPLVTVSLLGEQRTLTAELLTVSTLLSGIVGLYFTGLAVTDSAYRASTWRGCSQSCAMCSPCVRGTSTSPGGRPTHANSPHRSRQPPGALPHHARPAAADPSS